MVNFTRVKPKSRSSRVIVRAWGDEPVEMLAYRTENNGNTAIVGRKDSEKTIGLPVGDLYQFDTDFLVQLKSAFDSGDRQKLLVLYESWRNKVIEFPVVVAIDSIHDQEHVAHSERPPAGSE